MPAYQTIKKYDPAAYEALLGSLRSGLRNKATAAQLIGQVRSHVTTLVQQRLPRASDEAIVFYMRVMVQEMKELNKKNTELCYQFMFPQKYGYIDGRKYFSKQTQEADLRGLAAIIKTSAENPQAVPEESEVTNDLESRIHGYAQKIRRRNLVT